MDVRNSSGELVSILNVNVNLESRPVPKQQQELHRHNSSFSSHPPPAFFSSFPSQTLSHSHSLSFSSASPTPTLSPTTPSLDRSYTADSHTTKSSSPTTPDLAFATADTGILRHVSKLPLHPERNLAVALPSSSSSKFFHHLASPPAIMDPFPSNSQNTMTDLQMQQQFNAALQQFPVQPLNKAPEVPLTAFERNVLMRNPYAQPPLPAAKSSQKKNSYPCPVSKQYGCNEFFTTSGHAARHAKKHTGKKDAICPECAKAFTRKDNMEQHRRTHSGVRATSKNTSSSEESRTKRLKIERQKKQQETPTLSAATIPVNNTVASAQIALNVTTNNNNNMMLNNNVNNNANMNNNNNVAPVAQMEMGLLDPRLMDTSLTYDAEDFSGILPTSFQQNLSSLPNVPRPSLHRSSYQESLQGRSLPTTSTVAGLQQAEQQSSAEVDENPENPSPSHAPALDALALAASRQV